MSQLPNDNQTRLTQGILPFHFITDKLKKIKNKLYKIEENK